MDDFCRVCFSFENRLENISNTSLQETWDQLESQPVSAGTDPVWLCFICVAELKRCRDFVKKYTQSNLLLLELFAKENSLIEVKEQLKQHTIPSPLSTREVQVLDLTLPSVADDDTPQIEIKLEPYEIKNEFNDDLDIEDHSTSQLFNDCDIKSSDSEDDVPLKLIATNEPKLEINGEIVKSEKVRKKNKKVKIRADVIDLSKEEQLQEVAARAESANYLNSPYKCDLCYKGFLEVKTMEIHNRKHDKSQGPFSCDICHLQYSNAKKLQAHTMSSHLRRYKCQLCDFVSHTYHQAKEHDNWHAGFMFTCQLCGYKFHKSTSYLTHVRRFHPRRHVCVCCGRAFLSVHGLTTHTHKIHRLENLNTNVKSVKDMRKCDVCGLEVKPNLLEGHLQTHKNKERVKCSECNESFKDNRTLQGHIKRMHLGIKFNKNIVCEACGKTFTSNAALKYHQLSHTGEKPHPCTVCNKSFSNKYNLKVHLRTHSGDKPYQCDVCNKRFAQKMPLNRHYRTHTGVKPYTCHLCSRSFSQSNSLKLHIATVHLKMPSKHKKRKTVNAPEEVKQKEK